ncbi:MAG TPA: glycosyltransferase family 1 protein [Anaerolineales bacterium]|nr:glycosyltransferase family 1 protein [Anaerolineales bacterium]
MRIGIDATALPPQPVGAGNYIIHLIRSLAALDPAEQLVVFAQPGGLELINKPDIPVSWVIIPERSPFARLVWEQVGLPRLIRRLRIDLLHSLHYTRPFWLPCASVVTFHDMTFFLSPHLHTRSKRWFFPPAIRMSARRADALTAVSESTRQDAIRILGIPAEKITTTPLGVDSNYRVIHDPLQRARVREKYRLPEQYVLYVGLVEPRKNLPLLVRAYRDLIDQGISLPLVVAGGFGWGYDQVLQEIEKLDLKERVQFLGYVPQGDLPLVYNLACLFVYPTLYEGFGLPALEALACGVPVVTSAVASLPEIVGDAGILVSAGDQQALTGAMLAILSDPELSSELSKRGPARASLFTWKRTAQLTLQVYRQVLQTS